MLINWNTVNLGWSFQSGVVSFTVCKTRRNYSIIIFQMQQTFIMNISVFKTCRRCVAVFVMIPSTAPAQ